MKFIFSIFISLLLATPAVAQDCKVNKTTDPFTKETRLSSGFIRLGDGSVTIDADAREVDFLFSLPGADRCYDNNSTAYIHFEGTKSKTMFRNGGSMNCEGLFHFIFRNSASTTSQLQKLMTQKVSHIVFTGNNKKEHIVTLDSTQQKSFMDFANCVVLEAKGLLK
jgi:hypothetical protein